MTDKYFQFQERRLKRQLQKMISSENRIVEMFNEQSSILMNFLITSGYELDGAEQELIVTAILKFQQLAQRGSILSDLEEIIPHDDTAEEIFDKVASGQIWKDAAEQQYIDRPALWNYLTEISRAHDETWEENYTWIVDNLENIADCMNRINLLNPDSEPQQLQTEISIELIDDNRRRMYSECLKTLAIDFKITNINKKMDLLIGELLATEDSFIKSCQLELTVLLQFKEQYTFSKENLAKLDEALKHYGQMENIWSRSIPKNIQIMDASSNSDFIEDGTFIRNRKLNEVFKNINYLTGSKDYKKHFESLNWLMVNQIVILDILSNAMGGLDKLNANFPLVKTHAFGIHTRLSNINKIFRLCETELNQFILSLSYGELNLTTASEARDAATGIIDTLDSMVLSVNRKRQQSELLTDLSKDLGKCKQSYEAQAGRFFSWGCNNTLLLQFINDLNILIGCNAESKIGMLVQHINKNLNTHARYTDLVQVLKNFLEKAASCPGLSAEHVQISNLNCM